MSEIIQGTPEWFTCRRGRVTASRIGDMMARTKSGWASSRFNYMGELIAERLTGVSAPSYSNAAMQWGTEHEPNARSAYEFLHDCDVTQIGFVDHPEIDMSGASPDGLIGTDGLLEIKCPNTSTHIETLLSGRVPDRNLPQIHWQMACTLRTWCDFVSYDPRLPPSMQLFVRRVERDDNTIAVLEHNVRVFLAELQAKLDALRTQYDLASTLREAAE